MDKLKAYRILGLKANADFDAAREAYKTLIQDVHPEDEPERFSEIQTAYRYLLRLNSGNSRQSRAQLGAEAFQTSSEAVVHSDEDNFERLDLDHVIDFSQEESDIGQDELGELFEGVSEGADEEHKRILEYENDIDTINAFRGGTLQVKTIPPDYLAYLLKTYPLTKKDYVKLYAQINGIRDEENTQKNLDATKLQGLLLRGAICLLFFFVLSAIGLSKIAGHDVSLTTVCIVTLVLTAAVLFFSYHRARKKKIIESEKTDGEDDAKDESLIDIYSETIEIVNKARGIVPENKREIYISCIAAALNAIPYILSGFSYGVVFNIAFVFLYYAFRKQIPKKVCGFIELPTVMFFQLLSFLSLSSWDYKKYTVLVFLLINTGLIIYKIIKAVSKKGENAE